MGIMDFFSQEAGQGRRKWLDGQTQDVLEALQFYAGPSVDVESTAGLLSMFNPVQDVGEAMRDTRDGDYIGAAANTLSALAPVGAYKLAGAGATDDIANVLQDTLTGFSMKAQAATDAGRQFAGDEFGGVDIPEKAKEALRLIRERYGVDPEFSYHPTSWGKSAYVGAKIPGPNGTYVETGFRLSDHPTGDARKFSDGIPTVIDGDDVTPQSLFGEVERAYDRALPKMDAAAARRTKEAEARDTWGKLSSSQQKKYKKMAIRQGTPGGADLGARKIFEREFLQGKD